MNRVARRGPWLPEEDRTLLHLVQTQGANNWVRISQQLQHRSPKQCRERYHQNLKPSLKHEPISPQEGEVIEQMVADMGKRWAEIARHLGNRSDNAVKNWWNGSMNRRRRNPTQITSGFKQVGNRMQPMPFTNSDRNLHKTPTHAPVNLPRSHPVSLPPISATTLPTPAAVYSPHYHSDRAEQHTTLNRGHHMHIPSYDYDLRHQSLENSAATFPKPVVSRAQHSRHPQQRSELPPLRQPTYATGLETTRSTHDLPLVSPALSERSQSHSMRQPPSLVSDNLSTCSISPKTVTSPHLNIPTVVDVSTSNWHQHGPDTGPGPGTGTTHTTVLAPPTLTADLQDEQQKDYLLPVQRYDAVAHVNKIKDSRMHLSSLLE